MQTKWGLIQEITKLYTFHSPVRKGKYRLATWATSIAGEIPKEILTETIDGRRLIVNPAPHNYQLVYFLGEYERAVTEVITEMVRKDDVCLDIGANIGWYTTLLQQIVGSSGAVHAFEPVTNTFSVLERNVKLNSKSENVYLNNCALGDSEKDIEMFVFENLPDSRASLSSIADEQFAVAPSRMITLDSYLKAKKVPDVNFVKADIEGAELMMLRGAQQLFKQSVAPIWVIEMALATSEGFGYHPNDLIEYIGKQREYEFYEIDEFNFILKKISGFKVEEIGANVLCVPKNEYRERLSGLKVIE